MVNYENGVPVASKSAKKRHQNMPTTYCREHCSESSCNRCVLSGSRRPVQEEDIMTRGIKECPKCNKPNGTRAKTCIECGFDFTLPQEYDGPGTEKQAPEEKPEEPIVKCHKCDCDIESGTERVKDGEGVLCFDCFKKKRAEKLVPVEVPRTMLMRESRAPKVQDKQTTEIKQLEEALASLAETNKSLCQIVSEQEKAIRVLLQMVAGEDSDVILVQALAELHDLRNK